MEKKYELVVKTSAKITEEQFTAQVAEAEMLINREFDVRFHINEIVIKK